MARSPQTHHGRVLRTHRLTPHMIRVVLGGDGLHAFGTDGYTDHYVKLLFPIPGVAYPTPFDLATIRAELPRDQWPLTRTYTVRAWDPAARELTIDFVHHGDEGVAGPWAAAAQPGDVLHLSGPGGAYAPDPKADWHLLAGDEAALPAIAAALEALPAGAPATVLIEVAGPEERQTIDSPGSVELTWLTREAGQERPGATLLPAITALDFPPGTVHAFVHGEAHAVRDIRRHLRHDRGLARDQMSISGYWRHGTNEDGWQSSKAEWNERIEREQEAAPFS
ncbi:siderophore-interacting protein [Streptomyces sp. 4N509B]|uniref:siderophore-interacting protein n=1 Tax=Streptomyces sp. 4N509B TaxID=3457413 RepID=UPI003FD46915